MKVGYLAFVAALMLATTAMTAPSDQPKVESLAWLSGDWIAEDGARWTEERWAPPRGGTMLGTGLSGSGEAADNYEYMRITADGEGHIDFWGAPNGQTAVRFRLISSSANEAIFENPEHDFPVRIHYRREGNFLFATASGANGAGALNWRFRLR